MKRVVQTTGLRILRWFGIILVLIGFSFPAFGARKVSLAWDPSPGTYVAGYYLYYGMSSGVYPTRLNIGTNTTTTVNDLKEGLTHYFVVTAYSSDALESDPSNEVAYTAPTGPLRASGTATQVNGSIVGITLTDGGYGYTNTPSVRFLGGGGSGAQATAVVSNGTVVAVNVLKAGSGYTNGPLVVIAPPYIPNPELKIAPMTLLSFRNLTVGTEYQLQLQQKWYWTNVAASFRADSATHSRLVAGDPSRGRYRLTLFPAPGQAFATAQVVNGSVVGANVTAGGSGYVKAPTVVILNGGGSNAIAVASLSGGVVTGITITRGGSGYTRAPTIQIDPPPALEATPSMAPLIRLDAANLSPYDKYRIQFKPSARDSWQYWDQAFNPTNVTSSQFCFITNNTGFFRLEYLP